MENPVGACTGARCLSGANFLLDVIPYRHPDAAHILGGRYTAHCQAVALTSENDFRTLYRPGCALDRTFRTDLPQRPSKRVLRERFRYTGPLKVDSPVTFQ